MSAQKSLEKKSEKKLEKKDVLLTGATGAIGQAIGRALLKADYKVHLAGRDPVKLKSLSAQWSESFDSTCLVVHEPADFSKESQVKALVEQFFQKAVHPWGLVCNAGNFGALGAFLDLDFSHWKSGLDENFFSHALMIQSFAQGLRARSKNAGRIVALSGAGIGSSKFFENMSSYRIAKAAITQLVETLAPELSPLGLTLNAVAPGAVLSGMTQQALDAGQNAGKYQQEAEALSKSGGVSPDLTGDLVTMLMSENASALTGRLLSARFDRENVKNKASEIGADVDLYKLRRIDRELFSRNGK